MLINAGLSHDNRINLRSKVALANKMLSHS